MFKNLIMALENLEFLIGHKGQQDKKLVEQFLLKQELIIDDDDDLAIELADVRGGLCGPDQEDERAGDIFVMTESRRGRVIALLAGSIGVRHDHLAYIRNAYTAEGYREEGIMSEMHAILIRDLLARNIRYLEAIHDPDEEDVGNIVLAKLGYQNARLDLNDTKIILPGEAFRTVDGEQRDVVEYSDFVLDLSKIQP
jgi:hypothetical protein